MKFFLFFLLLPTNLFLKSMEGAHPAAPAGHAPTSNAPEGIDSQEAIDMILRTIEQSKLKDIRKLSIVVNLLIIRREHLNGDLIIFYKKFTQKAKKIIQTHLSEISDIFEIFLTLNSWNIYDFDELMAKYISKELKIKSPEKFKKLCSEEYNQNLLEKQLTKLILATESSPELTNKQKKLIFMHINNKSCKLKVKILNQMTYTINYSPKQNLESIKKKLESLTGIPRNRQQILFNSLFLGTTPQSGQVSLLGGPLEDATLSTLIVGSTLPEIELKIDVSLLGEEARKESIEIAAQNSFDQLKEGSIILLATQNKIKYARIFSIQPSKLNLRKAREKKSFRNLSIIVQCEYFPHKNDIQIQDIVGVLT